MTKYFNQEKVVVKILQTVGNIETPDSTEVYVAARNATGAIDAAKGQTVPTNGESGYEKGCKFIDLNQTNGAYPVYVNVGDSDSCEFQQEGFIDDNAEIGEHFIQYATVTVSNAEIKALNATPKTLVAAQGADTVVQLVSCVIKLNAGSEALTEPNNDENLQVLYGAGGTAATAAIEFTNFLDQTSDETQIELGAQVASAASSDLENKALVLENVGTGEIAGNASEDATLTVKVAYRVHDFS